MFFQSRKREEEIKELKNLMNQSANEVKNEVNALQKHIEEMSGNMATHMEELQEQNKNGEKLLRRQADSFEDLLDELQSQKEEREAMEEREKEWKSRERALVSLAGCCREQIALLERQLMQDKSMTEEKRTAWEKQFEIMEQEAKKFLRVCEIEETGVVGESVDYEVHEIVSSLETTEEENAGLVAEVYSRGYLYRGHVIRKAQISAYKKA